MSIMEAGQRPLFPVHSIKMQKHFEAETESALAADYVDILSTLYMGPTKRRMGAHWTAWTRIEAHGRARRRMDAHDCERTRSSRSGLQSRDAETLNGSEQEAFDHDSRQCDEERRRMDAHAGEWKGTQCMDMN